jgi:hypothetical protein
VPWFKSKSKDFDKARDPNTPPNKLAKLAKSSDPYVRGLVARNPATLEETVDMLANDPEEVVRTIVANNTSTPVALLEALTQDSSVRVRMSAFTNPQLPSALVAKMKDDANPRVRALAWVVETVKCQYAGTMYLGGAGFTAFDTKSDDHWFEINTGFDCDARVDLLSVAHDPKPIGALVNLGSSHGEEAKTMRELFPVLAYDQIGAYLVDVEDSMGHGQARPLDISGTLAFLCLVGLGETPSETQDEYDITFDPGSEGGIETGVTGRVWAISEPRDEFNCITQVLFLKDEYVSAFALDTPPELVKSAGVHG